MADQNRGAGRVRLARDPESMSQGGAMSGRARLRAWLVWWAVGALLWLVLEDTVSIAEDVDGAIAAALGASAAVLALTRARPRPAGLGGWSRMWRPLVSLVADLPALVDVLWRAVWHGERDPGRVRAVSFTCAEDPERRAAQIALATVAGSLAPSTVVIAVRAADDILLVHELVAGEGRRAADPLELG
jgi:multisubunit Na+/H+ antiporter MnhE subunit